MANPFPLYVQWQDSKGPQLNTQATWRNIFFQFRGREDFHNNLPVTVYAGKSSGQSVTWSQHLSIRWELGNPILGIYWLTYDIDFLSIEVSFDGGFPEKYFLRLIDHQEPDTTTSLFYTAGGRSAIPDKPINFLIQKLITGYRMI